MIPQPRKVLCYSRSPMNSVMLRPIVRRLAEYSDIRLFFAGKPSNTNDSIQEVMAPLREILPDTPNQPMRLPGRIIPHWLVRWLKFDLFISPDIIMPASRTPHRVQIFHGVSFKGKAYSDKINRFNHIFLVGEYMRQRFVQKGYLTADDPRGHRIGMPKTDPLLDGSLDAAQLIASLNLDTARPTVLYAPTWRKESSLNKEGEAIIDALDALKVNVLVKIHDHSRDPKTNRRDWVQYLLQRENDSVRMVRDSDIIPYLHAADVLVSDASSVANEYTLLDRPVIFMDVPELLEVYGGTADLDTWGRKIGTVVSGAGTLTKAVEDALTDPSKYSDIRRAAASDIFYNPGKATEAAVKTIREILGL